MNRPIRALNLQCVSDFAMRYSALKKTWWGGGAKMLPAKFRALPLQFISTRDSSAEYDHIRPSLRTFALCVLSKRILPRFLQFLRAMLLITSVCREPALLEMVKGSNRSYLEEQIRRFLKFRNRHLSGLAMNFCSANLSSTANRERVREKVYQMHIVPARAMTCITIRCSSRGNFVIANYGWACSTSRYSLCRQSARRAVRRYTSLANLASMLM